MIQATRYDRGARKHLGLPDLATKEDVSRSLEVSGVPTDPYKVEASKMFNVPYLEVTDQMRRAAKLVRYTTRYR